MDNPKVKAYTGPQIDITYEARRCLHIAECARGLPEVFDAQRRPWVEPDAAPADQVAEIVRLCPSGALQYRMSSGAGEEPERPTAISRSPAGQLVMRGDLRVRMLDGERQETRVMLCGCSGSTNMPYCDLSGPCGGS